MNRRIITILVIALALPGCATMEQSTLLGASMMGAVGAGVGAAAGNNVGTALLGLGVGAIFGGGLGYLAHKDKEEKERMTKFSLKKEDPAEPPSLSAPEVRRIWVPEKVEGGRLESGHWLWVIDKPSHFTR